MAKKLLALLATSLLMLGLAGCNQSSDNGEPVVDDLSEEVVVEDEASDEEAMEEDEDAMEEESMEEDEDAMVEVEADAEVE